ncbi:hypothetical protein G6F59_013410 [Rhizopus arrhizus]|nr:hypothetical protein G6F59_013410 [Rhizopus arrhizus]
MRPARPSHRRPSGRGTPVIRLAVAGRAQQVLAVQLLAIELVPDREAAPVRRQVSQALGQQRHPHSALVVLQQIEHTALGGKETTAAVAVEPPQRTGISAQQTVGRTRPVAALAVGQYQCRTQAGAVGPPRAADPVLRIDAIESVVLAADPDRAIRIAAHPQHAQRAKLPRRHRLEPMAVPACHAGLGADPQAPARIDQAAVDGVAGQAVRARRIMLEEAQAAVLSEPADPLAAGADPQSVLGVGQRPELAQARAIDRIEGPEALTVGIQAGQPLAIDAHPDATRRPLPS